MLAASDRRVLEAYLLGQLGPQERAAIEARYFEDDELFEHMEAIEDEWIAAYLRRELSSAQRAAFESGYLNSPERRQKVDFAAALMERIPGMRGSEARGSVWRAIAEFLEAQPMALRSSATLAALLLLIGLPASLWQVSRLGSEMDRLRREAVEKRAEAAQTATRLADEQGLRARLEQQLARLTTVSFVLMPGLERGSESALEAPRGASVIRLQLELERDERDIGYRAVLYNSEGRVVWSQDLSEFHSRESSRSPVAIVPAGLLPNGQYRVSLLARQAEVASYTFRIVRK